MDTLIFSQGLIICLLDGQGLGKEHDWICWRGVLGKCMSGSLKIRTEYEDICILYQCPPNSNTSRRGFNNQVEKIAHSIDASQPLLTLLQQLKYQAAIVVRGKLLMIWATWASILSTAEYSTWEQQINTEFQHCTRFPGKPDILRQVDYFLSHFLHERVIKFFSLEKTLILNTDLQS